ncbi:MAG: class A beta-lactamase-related serine hydrolase [Mongoliibacter sp.]|nr:MAG: class A beta-lactamase-related serine hydrolase [Mongoliibacter sp.]
MYFPPTGSNTWEASSPSSLDWDSTQIGDLLTLLEGNGTRAFIILKDGKIVLEEYFGTRLATNQAFDKNSLWYWASAGKTLTAATIGIAAEQNKMDIFASSSKYLGEGWTSLTRDAEQEINVWHHLTMTSGINDDVANLNDFSPENLRYQSEPGLRWAYHNALYTLLYNVVESATGMSFNDFFNQNLASKIGMTGSWQRIGFNNVYFSNARSMARFGLFILANGEWDGVSVLSKDFVQEMISTSQSINESYGYLWWINGKNSFMVPSIQAQFPGSFAPNAPDDMVCGIGKDGQYICVVPSSGIVLVRMGENPDQALVPFRFIDDIWKELNNIIVQ